MTGLTLASVPLSPYHIWIFPTWSILPCRRQQVPLNSANSLPNYRASHPKKPLFLGMVVSHDMVCVLYSCQASYIINVMFCRCCRLQQWSQSIQVRFAMHVEWRLLRQQILLQNDILSSLPKMLPIPQPTLWRRSRVSDDIFSYMPSNSLILWFITSNIKAHHSTLFCTLLIQFTLS